MNICKPLESEEMEKFYTLHPWIEDPETPRGFERYQQELKVMEKLVAHPWLQELFKSNKSVSVIDICSGTGIRGVAFCKVLKNKDLEVSLALIDLRVSPRQSSVNSCNWLCVFCFLPQGSPALLGFS